MLASGRTCTGRMRKEGDPPGASRTRPPARRSWSLAPRFGNCGGRPSPAANALSAFARTRVFHRDGRGRRQDAGERALLRAEPGRRRTLVRPLRAIGPAPRQPTAARATPATDPWRREPPRRESRLAQSRCRPALERLRKRPSRTGRAQMSTKQERCQGFFSGKSLFRQLAAALTPPRRRGSGGGA